MSRVSPKKCVGRPGKPCAVFLIGKLRGRRHCPACSPTNDPGWRKRRAKLAGAGAARAKLRAVRERLEREGVPPERAWLNGYATGYRRAYAKWKCWAEEMIAAKQQRGTKA
jgi:hypothetical protein